MLNKCVSLLMSVFVLAQSFNIHLADVLQLESLYEHIEFHEATYGDDIFSFISKHYGKELQEHDKDSQDDSEHEKLPFNHRISCDSLHYCIVNWDQNSLLVSDTPSPKKGDFFYYNFYSYLENTDIFQPPRFA